MSVILEYEISQATEKLPSLHDRRNRLEVYIPCIRFQYELIAYIWVTPNVCLKAKISAKPLIRKNIYFNSLANEGHYHTEVLHLALL